MIYQKICPIGSKRPRLYGLPKTHKEHISFIQMLSMVCSATDRFAKWMADILESVLELYSLHFINDASTFGNYIQNRSITFNNLFFCSFDIESSYTNVLWLNIDLWQRRHSGNYETGCSSCVNKVITGKQAMRGCKQIMWITYRKKSWRYQIIYTQLPADKWSVLVRQFEQNPSQGRSCAGRHSQWGAIGPLA